MKGHDLYITKILNQSMAWTNTACASRLLLSHMAATEENCRPRALVVLLFPCGDSQPTFWFMASSKR